MQSQIQSDTDHRIVREPIAPGTITDTRSVDVRSAIACHDAVQIVARWVQSQPDQVVA